MSDVQVPDPEVPEVLVPLLAVAAGPATEDELVGLDAAVKAMVAVPERITDVEMLP